MLVDMRKGLFSEISLFRGACNLNTNQLKLIPLANLADS